MKDVYELLNDVDIDLSQYEEVELSDIEKKHIKKRLHQSLKVGIIPKVSKVVAAVLCIIVISGFTLVKTAPTFAVGIPVVGDIIKHMTGYDYAEFDKYTSVINKAVDKNGVKITLNEVMMDKNQLRIATTFKSTEKLKDKVLFMESPKIFINGKQLNPNSGGTGQLVDDNTFLDVATFDIHDVKIPANISMKVVYDKFQIGDGLQKDTKIIPGPWEFQFNVSKSEIEKSSKVIKLNRSINSNSEKISIKDLSITPLTTNLSYKFSGEDFIRFIIKDDKGKELVLEGGGCETEGMFVSLSRGYKGYENFSAVSKEVKKLYITPYFNYGNTKEGKEGKGKAVKTEPVKWNNETVTLKQDDNNKIIVSKIQRKDGRVYVDYKTEGISVNIQKYRLYLYNSSRERLNITLDEGGNIANLRDSEDMIHAVFIDKGNGDIYVGTDNMADVSVIKDSEFTVDLK
jgi:hypothetical protein